MYLYKMSTKLEQNREEEEEFENASGSYAEYREEEEEVITNDEEFVNASGSNAEYREKTNNCDCCWTDYYFTITCTLETIKITENTIIVVNCDYPNEEVIKDTKIYQGDECADFLSNYSFEIELKKDMKYLASCVSYFNNKKKA